MKNEWQNMATAPKDGTEIIVLIDSAACPIVRTTWWHDGDDGESTIGWWSYRHSVTQELLEGYDEPRAWVPLPEYSEFMR